MREVSRNFQTTEAEAVLNRAVADMMKSGQGWLRLTATGLEHVPLEDVLLPNPEEPADGKS